MPIIEEKEYLIAAVKESVAIMNVLEKDKHPYEVTYCNHELLCVRACVRVCVCVCVCVCLRDINSFISTICSFQTFLRVHYIRISNAIN